MIRRTVSRLGMTRCLATSSSLAARCASISSHHNHLQHAAGCSALTTARRFNAAAGMGGADASRENETWLSQYEPLDVLGLNENANRKDIEAAYAKTKETFGPRGILPNVKTVERAEKAMQILGDPNSIYYTRALASEEWKHRLHFQFLDDRSKLLTQWRVAAALCGIFLGFYALVAFAFHPYKKIKRAAMARV